MLENVEFFSLVQGVCVGIRVLVLEVMQGKRGPNVKENSTILGGLIKDLNSYGMPHRTCKLELEVKLYLMKSIILNKSR